MADEYGASIASAAFRILGVGLIMAFIFVGGGFALPFLTIPWYIWAFLLLLLIFWIIS